MNVRFALSRVLGTLLFGSFSAQAGVEVISFDVGGSPSNHIFLTTGAATAPAPQADPGAMQVWPVTVNLAFLHSPQPWS